MFIYLFVLQGLTAAASSWCCVFFSGSRPRMCRTVRRGPFFAVTFSFRIVVDFETSASSAFRFRFLLLLLFCFRPNRTYNGNGKNHRVVCCTWKKYHCRKTQIWTFSDTPRSRTIESHVRFKALTRPTIPPPPPPPNLGGR